MAYITDAAKEYAKKIAKAKTKDDKNISLQNYIDDLLEYAKNIYGKPSIDTAIINGAADRQIDKIVLKNIFERTFDKYYDVNEFIDTLTGITERDIQRVERKYNISFNKNDKNAFIKKGIQKVFAVLNDIYGDVNAIFKKNKNNIEKLKTLSQTEKDKILFDLLAKDGLTEYEIKKLESVARTLTMNDIISHNLWHQFGVVSYPGDSPAGILLEHAYKNDFNKMSNEEIQGLNEYLSTVDDPLSLLYEEIDDRGNYGFYDIDDLKFDQATVSKLKQLVKKGYELVRKMNVADSCAKDSTNYHDLYVQMQLDYDKALAQIDKTIADFWKKYPDSIIDKLYEHGTFGPGDLDWRFKEDIGYPHNGHLTKEEAIAEADDKEIK